MLLSNFNLPSRVLILAEAGRTSKGANLTVLDGFLRVERSQFGVSRSGDGVQSGDIKGHSSDVDSSRSIDSISGRNLFVDGWTHAVAGNAGDGKKDGMGIKPGRRSKVSA